MWSNLHAVRKFSVLSEERSKRSTNAKSRMQSNLQVATSVEVLGTESKRRPTSGGKGRIRSNLLKTRNAKSRTRSNPCPVRTAKRWDQQLGT